MRTVFFIPALTTLSGGLANIYTVAEKLAAQGKDVALMGPGSGTPGLGDLERKGLTVLPWGSELRPTDTWCIPESWPNSIAVGTEAGARVLVYVQNWVYLLTTLPQGVRWSGLPLEFVAVSRPVAWFMHTALGLTVAGIVPASVAPVFFQRHDRPTTHIRIAFMPRKNRALAEQVRHVTMACLAENPAAPKVEWTAIHGMTRKEVADTLAGCHFYLSTGFPEGFGLPAIEAMASGCVPVGFTGFGGWEYMRQATMGTIRSRLEPDAGLGNYLTDLPGHTPYTEVPCQETGGNGFYFADGDTVNTGMALARLVLARAAEQGPWDALEQACRATASRYSEQEQEKYLGVFGRSL